MPKRRALVIGGSLGGLLAANMLHSIGWQVDVYERTGDDLAARGALSRDPGKWIRESGARLRDLPELLELVEARRRRMLSPDSTERSL